MEQNIRNFAIVAHIDHGKSTLADRFLEITKTVSKEKIINQFLDQNPISRERGITIKLAPVRMNYEYNGVNYILNLIDTPGHVDFSYEVSRTLACCEGVILLVDATQGIQAQTVAHFNAAKKQNLVIIPVINKIDMPNAQSKIVAKAMCNIFGFNEEEILYISAKTGENTGIVLKKVVEKIPAPTGNKNLSLRALVFDAVYDEHRGVIAFVRIVDGNIKHREKIKLIQEETLTQGTEVGYFSPFLSPSAELKTGEIGYIITGVKDIHECRVGDTITNSEFPSLAKRSGAGKIQNSKFEKVEPLPGYEPPKPMVFFGVYPKNPDDFVRLKEGLSRLTLKDASLTFSEDYSSFLGSGFRVGFLGLLHAEIIKERLKREEKVEPLLTIPQVLYKKNPDGSMLEPYISLLIYSPVDFIGNIMSLCQRRKGKLINTLYHDTYAVLEYELPYSMFIRGLSSELKSASSGFASVDYEFIGFRSANLINLEIIINDHPIDVLSEYVYKDEVIYKAREKTEKLKELLPRQQFRQIIQGVIDGKIIAREEIPPFRKDVVAKLSGGDRTRKDKLLKKQKKGKRRLENYSKVNLPQEALLSFLEK
ncbi:MAG: translation elongation factor 4 [Patescibacteria group bacterium]|nr:translation elongation factor 4 [Patescibacteria group bacterium]